MSIYYKRIQSIISQQADPQQFQDYYTHQAIYKLNNVDNPNSNCFLLLEDLKKHIKKHPNNNSVKIHIFDNTNCNDQNVCKNNDEMIFFGDEIIKQLQDKLFFLKSLQLRAIILDIVDTDYESDVQTFFKPENWIFEVVEKIEETFKNLDIKDCFVVYFGDVIVNTFLCSNKKFGYNGNQLVINLMYYEKEFQVKLDHAKNELRKNLKEGRILTDDELEKIIEEK